MEENIEKQESRKFLRQQHLLEWLVGIRPKTLVIDEPLHLPKTSLDYYRKFWLKPC